MSIKDFCQKKSYQDWLDLEGNKVDSYLRSKPLISESARGERLKRRLITELAPDKKQVIVLDHIQDNWMVCTPEEAELIKSKTSKRNLFLKIKSLLEPFAIEDKDYDNLIDFISEHNFLVEIVQESSKQIKKIFGEKAEEVSLEVFEDIEEGFKCLFAVVKTSLPVKQSHDLLEKLEDEWLLDNVTGKAALVFSVTVRSAST